MSRPHHESERNQEATVYLGNLDERLSDTLVWELMLQAGPVVNVHLPKDRISQTHQGFGFCEFLTEDDAEYACRIMNQIKLYGKPIRVNKASYDKKQLDVGANLFIGNLDVNVDERTLYDTFSAFGIISQTAKIARDPTSGESKGYGFVSYNDFESADAAIEQMNGQFLMNKAVTVQYAFKKDGKGERHGTPAERLLAAQAMKNNVIPGAGAMPSGMMGGPPGGRPPMPGMPPQQGMTGGNQTPLGFQGSFAGALAPPPPPPGFGPSSVATPYAPQQQQYGQIPPPPPPPGFAAQPNYSIPPPGFPNVPPPGFGGGSPANGYPIPPPPPPPPMM